jgi:hypothetical protein
MLQVVEQNNQPIPTREKILELQESMLPLQCGHPEPTHFFAPGMYLRELTIPAGMLVVGKTHKHAHFLMVLKGRAEVVSEFGREIVTAGYIGVSQPGVKRVVLAIEDTQFVTVHANQSDTQDLDIIEAEHIEPEVLNLANDYREVIE